MKKEDLERYYFEHRHQRRYKGIFLMFAVIAVVLGIMAAFLVANMSGNSVFGDLFGTKTTNEAQFNGMFLPANQTFVTYQGVLNMMNKCFTASSNIGEMNTTCNNICGANNLGTCTAGFIIDSNLTHQDRPVPCGYPIWKSSHRLYCSCCSIPK